MTAYTAYSIIKKYKFSFDKTIEIDKSASMIGIKIKKYNKYYYRRDIGYATRRRLNYFKGFVLCDAIA